MGWNNVGKIIKCEFNGMSGTLFGVESSMICITSDPERRTCNHNIAWTASGWSSLYGEIQRKWSIDIYHLSLCNTMVIGVPWFYNPMSANSCLVKLHYNLFSLKHFCFRSSTFNNCFIFLETFPCIDTFWNVFVFWTF